MEASSLQHILTNAYKAEMIAYLEVHPEAFNEAAKWAISDKQPWACRAAWLLWSCMEENDLRMQLYIDRIVASLAFRKDDHQRELIKILLLMELSEEHEGVLFNVCAGLWEKISKKPSVRFTAFRMLVKIARKHNELSQEILLLTQDHYLDSLSSAARKSVMKMASQFSKKGSVL